MGHTRRQSRVNHLTKRPGPACDTTYGRQIEGGFLTAELWQFAALIGGFLLVAVLWLCIIYLPGRTMEYSEARRSKARDRDGESPGS